MSRVALRWVLAGVLLAAGSDGLAAQTTQPDQPSPAGAGRQGRRGAPPGSARRHRVVAR